MGTLLRTAVIVGIFVVLLACAICPDIPATVKMRWETTFPPRTKEEKFVPPPAPMPEPRQHEPQFPKTPPAPQKPEKPVRHIWA